MFSRRSSIRLRPGGLCLCKARQLLLAGYRSRGPKSQQEKIAPKGLQLVVFAGQGSGKEKSGARKGSISQVSAECWQRLRRSPTAPRDAYSSGTSPQTVLCQIVSRPSSISIRWFTGKCSNFCVMSTGPANRRANRCLRHFPTPKKSSLLCCDRNPDPACRYFVWRLPTRFNGYRRRSHRDCSLSLAVEMRWTCRIPSSRSARFESAARFGSSSSTSNRPSWSTSASDKRTGCHR